MSCVARRRAWVILSELFVDQDVATMVDDISGQLRELPFDADDLHQILIFEVTPVCIGNLFQIAGNWTGFDEAALCAAIEARWRLGWVLSPLRRWQVARMVPEWAEIYGKLKAVEP